MYALSRGSVQVRGKGGVRTEEQKTRYTFLGVKLL